MKILNYFFEDKKDTSLNFNYSGITKYCPLIVVGGFFLLTIVLFAFGPLNWNISNPFKLYSFLFLSCVALFIGYFLSVKYFKSNDKVISININTLFLIGSIVYIILYIPTVYITTGKLYPDIYTGIMNTGEAYRLSKYYNEVNSPLILYIRMILSPLMFSITPLTVYFFSKLSKGNKFLGIIIIVLNIFLGISQGINKNVADIVSQLVLALFIMLLSNNNKTNSKIYRTKLFFLIILLCTLFFLYYANGMTNRVETDIQNSTSTNSVENSSLTENTEDASDSSIIQEPFDNSNSSSSQYTREDSSSPANTSSESVASSDNSNAIDETMQQYSLFSVATEKENYWLSKVIPQKIMTYATFLTSYLTHGYYGLSLALEEDFTSTYGLGFSDFFRHNFLKLFNDPDLEDKILSQTYQGKITGKGWSVGDVWGSFFIFPASDISFPGTILLVLLIGFLFGLSWKDALTTHNPFAISSFFGFSTMIFYFSANNQMFQGGENFIGFTITIICWLISRRISFRSQS